ncbi:MAG: hypothetical protein O7A09_00550, partial [Proteobacteria bacterium]|nr:hypothetical protein [Pseudomonadota bacterium]
MGYSYLTAVIDAIDARGFEGALQAEVLGPLHMESSTYALGASSTYALADPLRDRLAAGHVPAWMPPALFGALFAAASAVVWLVGWTVLRFGLRGRVTVRGAALLLALSLALAVVAGSTLGGIPAALFCASVFVVPAAVVAGLWRAT